MQHGGKESIQYEATETHIDDMLREENNRDNSVGPLTMNIEAPDFHDVDPQVAAAFYTPTPPPPLSRIVSWSLPPQRPAAERAPSVVSDFHLRNSYDDKTSVCHGGADDERSSVDDDDDAYVSAHEGAARIERGAGGAADFHPQLPSTPPAGDPVVEHLLEELPRPIGKRPVQYVPPSISNKGDDTEDDNDAMQDAEQAPLMPPPPTSARSSVGRKMPPSLLRPVLDNRPPVEIHSAVPMRPAVAQKSLPNPLPLLPPPPPPMLGAIAAVEPIRRRPPGRPRKNQAENADAAPEPPRRPVGRPRKNPLDSAEAPPRRPIGRPRKDAQPAPETRGVKRAAEQDLDPADLLVDDVVQPAAPAAAAVAAAPDSSMLEVDDSAPAAASAAPAKNAVGHKLEEIQRHLGARNALLTPRFMGAKKARKSREENQDDQADLPSAAAAAAAASSSDDQVTFVQRLSTDKAFADNLRRFFIMKTRNIGERNSVRLAVLGSDLSFVAEQRIAFGVRPTYTQQESAYIGVLLTDADHALLEMPEYFGRFSVRSIRGVPIFCMPDFSASKKAGEKARSPIVGFEPPVFPQSSNYWQFDSFMEQAFDGVRGFAHRLCAMMDTRVATLRVSPSVALEIFQSLAQSNSGKSISLHFKQDNNRVIRREIPRKTKDRVKIPALGEQYPEVEFDRTVTNVVPFSTSDPNFSARILVASSTTKTHMYLAITHRGGRPLGVPEYHQVVTTISPFASDDVFVATTGDFVVRQVHGHRAVVEFRPTGAPSTDAPLDCLHEVTWIPVDWRVFTISELEKRKIPAADVASAGFELTDEHRRMLSVDLRLPALTREHIDFVPFAPSQPEDFFRKCLNDRVARL